MALEKMSVLDLLDQMEDILDTATAIIPGRVFVNKDELKDIIDDIKKSLPDDVQQARWVKEQGEAILDDAKRDYDTIILEAKKQADYMVEEHVITERAVQMATEIYRRADSYAKELTLSAYDYVDRTMFELREKMDAMKAANDRHFENLYGEFEKAFSELDSDVEKNMKELRKLATDVKENPLPEHDPRLPANFESE